MPQVTNYPNDESVSLNDKVFGTDSKTNKNKNFIFADIVNLVNGVSGKDFIQYKFSLTDYLNTGSFAANSSKTNPTEITKFFFSKQSNTKKDLSVIFDRLDMLKNIVISLKNPGDANNFATFKIINITKQNTYFEFDVLLYNDFFVGSLLPDTIYSVCFDVKENFEDKTDQVSYVKTVSPSVPSGVPSDGDEWITYTV